MASILIVLDQPVYGNLSRSIASSSLHVLPVFAGDIASKNLDALNDVRGRRFDTILLPATITEKSSDYEAVRDFCNGIKSPDTKIHRYENQY